MAPSRPHVQLLVVGAGLAGLVAAREARRGGQSVLVLEADKRPGGRVRTIEDWLPREVLHAGGEFVGSTHHALRDLADRLGTPLRPTTFPDLEHRDSLGGRLLTPDESRSLRCGMDGIEAQIGRVARDLTELAPRGSAGERELDHTSVLDLVGRLGGSAMARRAVLARLSTYNGVPAARQSALALLVAVRAGGVEDFWRKSAAFRWGERDLVDALAAEVGLSRTLYQHRVVAVDRAAAGGVRLEVEGAGAFRAERVVIATPPTAWNSIEFRPAPPPAPPPQMGRAGKLFVHARLRAGQRPLHVFSDGPVGTLWMRPLGDGGGGGVGEEVLVSCFVGGDAAASLGGEADEDARTARALAALHELVGDAIETVLGARLCLWPLSAFGAGGYSFPAVGEVGRLAAIWEEGVGRMFFAGEHTEVSFAGFMEGAVRSGLRAGRWALEKTAIGT